MTNKATTESAAEIIRKWLADNPQRTKFPYDLVQRLLDASLLRPDPAPSPARESSPNGMAGIPEDNETTEQAFAPPPQPADMERAREIAQEFGNWFVNHELRDEAVSRLKEKIATLLSSTPESGWRPIATLTESDKDILIVYPNSNGRPVVMHCYEWCDVARHEGETALTQAENVGATLWMPTPAPPAQEG